MGAASCRPLLEGIRSTGERQSWVFSPKSPSLCIPHPYPVFAFVQRSCTSFTWGRKGHRPGHEEQTASASNREQTHGATQAALRTSAELAGGLGPQDKSRSLWGPARPGPVGLAEPASHGVWVERGGDRGLGASGGAAALIPDAEAEPCSGRGMWVCLAPANGLGFGGEAKLRFGHRNARGCGVLQGLFGH